jgi:hypothetical protein
VIDRRGVGRLDRHRIGHRGVGRRLDRRGVGGSDGRGIGRRLHRGRGVGRLGRGGVGRLDLHLARAHAAARYAIADEPGKAFLVGPTHGTLSAEVAAAARQEEAAGEGGAKVGSHGHAPVQSASRMPGNALFQWRND